MKNEIYYADNLKVLRKHIKNESVDFCYITPPFNSKFYFLTKYRHDTVSRVNR
jgi:hypothetical protein